MERSGKYWEIFLGLDIWVPSCMGSTFGALITGNRLGKNDQQRQSVKSEMINYNVNIRKS